MRCHSKLVILKASRFENHCLRTCRAENDEMRQSEEINHQELLKWQIAMGADEAVGNEPVDWFAWSLENLAKKPQTNQQSPQLPRRVSPERIAPSAAEPVNASQDLISDARKLAKNCNSIDELISALKSFDACPLARTASNLCFIDGNTKAKILIIGEAPEREEDLQGKPFVGRSGQLLDKILGHIGLSRDHENNDQSVLMSNMVFWRPPGNRKASDAEISMCMPFLTKLIELVNPQIIVCLGATPTQRLTGETKGISRLRGRWFSYVGSDQKNDNAIAILATLHPDYLLRQPMQKKLAWQDFIALKLRLLNDS